MTDAAFALPGFLRPVLVSGGGGAARTREVGDGDASPALRLTGHGPGSDPEGWVGGRWSIRAGWGSCPRFRKCQAAGLEAALLPLCPPGCRLPGTELSTWDQGRVGRMFGYKMGPWFGEGSSLRPLHPGPGLSPQLCSTKLVGGRQLYLCLVTGGPWFPASSSRFRRPSRAQAEPGGAVGPGPAPAYLWEFICPQAQLVHSPLPARGQERL